MEAVSSWGIDEAMGSNLGDIRLKSFYMSILIIKVPHRIKASLAH